MKMTVLGFPERRELGWCLLELGVGYTDCGCCTLLIGFVGLTHSKFDTLLAPKVICEVILPGI